MRAVICGAGIAGLTLGWWLARDGWDVLTVEKAPGLRDEGYMIDFFGPGYRVAEAMGLIPRLRELRYDVREVKWIDASERTVARIDYARMREIFKDRVISLMRGDLERALYEDRPNGSDIRFGCSIANVHMVEPHVDLTLTTGERLQADLLIGADGVHSAVRRYLFPAEAGVLRYLGLQTAAFVFEDAAARETLGDSVQLLAVPGRQAGFYPIRGGKIATFFVHHAADARHPDVPVAELKRIYGDLGWLVPAALRHAQSLSDIYYDQVAQVVLPRWSKGRATLIGDAGYAVSLLAGQGASLAMAGAGMLAAALREERTIEAALSRYEQRMRPIAEATQKAGRKMANWFAPAEPWRLFVRNIFLRLTRVPGLDALLFKSLAAGADKT
jgi:2-polyprenyl-6-methoxyphenol hydroxylase-like FAD-dependent oxidoreductase